MCKIIIVLMILLTAAGAGIFYHGAILEKAGNMTYKKDALKPADAIVVLAGEPEERVEYGAELFRRGLSRKNIIVMTGGQVVWKYSWAEMMKEHAVFLGVPEKSILLADKSRSTEEDAVRTKEILVKQGLRSVILVTSPYHSRRASIIYSRVLGKDYEIVSAPAEHSWFSYDKWWMRRRDRAMIMHEFSKFIWLSIFGVGTY